MFPANDNYIVIEGFCGEVLIDLTERQAMGKAAGFIQKAGVYEKKAPGFVCPAVYFLQAKQENQKKL